MPAIRCYPRDKFEKILTGNLKLTRTDQTHKGQRKWKTPDGKTIWISDISDDEALSQTYVEKISYEVASLGVDIEPPASYPWGI